MVYWPKAPTFGGDTGTIEHCTSLILQGHECSLYRSGIGGIGRDEQRLYIITL